MRAENTPIPVSGIHLSRIGGDVIVQAEIDGVWVEVIREPVDSLFSRIVEPGDMRMARGKVEP